MEGKILAFLSEISFNFTSIGTHMLLYRLELWWGDNNIPISSMRQATIDKNEKLFDWKGSSQVSKLTKLTSPDVSSNKPCNLKRSAILETFNVASF